MEVIVTTRTRSETTKGRCVLGIQEDLEDVQQLLTKKAGACLVNYAGSGPPSPASPSIPSCFLSGARQGA